MARKPSAQREEVQKPGLAPEADTKVSTETTNQASDEALKTRIAELEAKVAAGEQGALDRVCKAMGIDSKSIGPEKPKVEEPIIRCEVLTPVTVNGRIYKGIVEVPKSTFEVIAQAVGDRRMRILRESIGSKFVLQEVQGGGFQPKLVERTNEYGEQV